MSEGGSERGYNRCERSLKSSVALLMTEGAGGREGECLEEGERESQESERERESQERVSRTSQ